MQAHVSSMDKGCRLVPPHTSRSARAHLAPINLASFKEMAWHACDPSAWQTCSVLCQHAQRHALDGPMKPQPSSASSLHIA